MEKNELTITSSSVSFERRRVNVGFANVRDESNGDDVAEPLVAVIDESLGTIEPDRVNLI
jgi:hypothetical protein